MTRDLTHLARNLHAPEYELSELSIIGESGGPCSSIHLMSFTRPFKNTSNSDTPPPPPPAPAIENRTSRAINRAMLYQSTVTVVFVPQVDDARGLDETTSRPKTVEHQSAPPYDPAPNRRNEGRRQLPCFAIVH